MTREDLVKHSLKHFLQHGIRKMTIKQIIDPLGISTKTVYKYFSGKEDMLEACLTIHYAEIKERFNGFTKLPMDPVARLSTLLNMGIEEDFKTAPVFYHDLNYYYPQLQDKVMAKGLTNYNKYLAQIITDGITQRLFRPELDPLVIRQTIDLLYRSLTRSETYNSFKLSPFELATNTLNAYLRGCCTIAGLASLDQLTIPKT